MNIRNIVISLLLMGMISISSFAQAETYKGGVSNYLVVDGKVTKKAFIDIYSLQALPPSTVNVTFFAAGSVVSQPYTGALLWDLLNEVGITVDPTIKNDILHKSVVVTGSDGYEAVFGAGELDPAFGGSQIIVAYATAGRSLVTDGFAKIIVPGDKAGGRFVSNIVQIKVISTDK
jgi:hypothetical protein